MEKEEFIAIAGKITDGNASADEMAEYLSIYDQFQIEHRDWDVVIQTEKEQEKDAVWNRISVNLYPKKTVSTISLWQKVAVTAVVLLSISAALVFFLPKVQPRINGVLAGNEVYPGSNKAMLTLADGKVITLNEAKEGVVIGSDALSYNDGTQVDPNAVIDQDHVTQSIEKQLLTATTPRGGTYRITLSDGTNVWLNAGSTLKFPSSFDNETKRIVELSGEAYFEIAKDVSHPFVVETKGQQIEVLGTHFNVNCYTDEAITKTTLLEGSVKVGAMGAGKTVLLKPGQQSLLSNGHIQVQPVDTDEAIAWKNGYFQFDGKNLETALLELSRWYNVDIKYKDNSLRKQALAGSISKYEDVNNVLMTMELTGVLNFSVVGRTIIVEKY